MHELQELLKDIEKLRKNLYQLIEKNGIDLQDPEVISSSQALNTAISKYNEMLRKKV